jgi:DNA polymerase-3 subunit epsilon
MGLIEKEMFVCLDCEFTGLDPENDRILEVAAGKFTLDTVHDKIESLIDPEGPISETSIAIHHITPEMVQGKPKIGEVLPNLLKFIGNHILVGHGVDFDVKWIVNAAKRLNIPCNLQNNRTLDTLRMARLYGESPVNSLDFLRQHFNIEEEGAHRAMSDVLVNMEVFKKLAHGYKRTEELFDILSRPILMKVMPLGKHKGRNMKEVPLPYLLWASHMDFDQDLLFSIRTEIKKRRKGNQFGQANNPFADL